MKTAQRFKKLWLYTARTTECNYGPAWAKDAEHYRQITGCPKEVDSVRRGCPDWPLPEGYRKTGPLACDHIEPIPTMREFVKALS